jgi:hypothetical protein
MNYKLTQSSRQDCFSVEGLPSGYDNRYPNTLLLVRYPEGDCDTVGDVGENMHKALYDLYQTSDVLKDGDTFSCNNVTIYKCSGVDVIPITYPDDNKLGWTITYPDKETTTYLTLASLHLAYGSESEYLIHPDRIEIRHPLNPEFPIIAVKE